MTTKIEGIVIYAYTRRQAIADGVLVDVSKVARETGFRCPVAITAAVYHDYVELPQGVRGQDRICRLMSILHMLQFHLQYTKTKESTVVFGGEVNNGNGPKRTMLKSVCGPDDDGQPCITIMMPNED